MQIASQDVLLRTAITNNGRLMFRSFLNSCFSSSIAISKFHFELILDLVFIVVFCIWMRIDSLLVFFVGFCFVTVVELEN